MFSRTLSQSALPRHRHCRRVRCRWRFHLAATGGWQELRELWRLALLRRLRDAGALADWQIAGLWETQVLPTEDVNLLEHELEGLRGALNQKQLKRRNLEVGLEDQIAHKNETIFDPGFASGPKKLLEKYRWKDRKVCGLDGQFVRCGQLVPRTALLS